MAEDEYRRRMYLGIPYAFAVSDLFINSKGDVKKVVSKTTRIRGKYSQSIPLLFQSSLSQFKKEPKTNGLSNFGLLFCVVIYGNL